MKGFADKINNTQETRQGINVKKVFYLKRRDGTAEKFDYTKRIKGNVKESKISTGGATIGRGTGTVTFLDDGVEKTHKFTVLKELADGNYSDKCEEKVEISTILHSEKGNETLILHGDILIKIEPALPEIAPPSSSLKKEADSYQEQEDGTYIEIGDGQSNKLTIDQIYTILKDMRKKNWAAVRGNFTYDEVILAVEYSLSYSVFYKVNIFMARNVKK